MKTVPRFVALRLCSVREIPIDYVGYCRLCSDQVAYLNA